MQPQLICDFERIPGKPASRCRRCRIVITNNQVSFFLSLGRPCGDAKKQLETRGKFPDLAPAAEKLGVQLDDAKRYVPYLAAWTMDGFPELTPEELRARDEICFVCEFKRPRGWYNTICVDDSCDSKGAGCGSGRRRPPLFVMRRLPRCRCPEERWPGDKTCKLPSSPAAAASSGVVSSGS